MGLITRETPATATSRSNLPSSATAASKEILCLRALRGRRLKGDIPDDRSLISYYLVLGYPASRTQVTILNERSEIRQKLFHLRTAPVEAGEYTQEGLPQPDYILLDFDHKEILIGGKPASLPMLQGVSGGGIFHVSELSPQSTLTAIATQNRRQSRLIVGTRLKHFLDAAREIKAAAPSEYLD